MFKLVHTPLRTLLATSFLLIGSFCAVASPAQTPATSTTATSSAKAKASKATATSGASQQEIADAKAKGLVWANLNSKIYHKDGANYGKTKNGKFMTEDDAKKAGFREAKPSAINKKAAASSAKS
jgi:hypothetical protein